jgi:4-hydroxybenzoate polyprenyltransferase
MESTMSLIMKVTFETPARAVSKVPMLDPKYHALTIWASVGFAAVFVVYLLLVGSLEANLWLGFTLFAVLAYSVPKLRFKERPFLDSFTSAVHFVGPMVYGLVLAGSSITDPKGN